MKKKFFLAFLFVAVSSALVFAQNNNDHRGNLFFSGSYSRGFISDSIYLEPGLHIFDLNIARVGAHYELPLGPGLFAFGLEAGYASGSRFGGTGDVDFFPLNIAASYVFPLTDVFYVGPSLKAGAFGIVGPDWSRMELMAGPRLEAEFRSANFPVGFFVSGGADFFPNAIANGFLPIVEVGARFPRGTLLLSGQDDNRNRDEGAGEDGDEGEAREGRIRTSTDVELQLTTQPAAKLALSQTFTFPFLRGESPLTRDNNISAVLTADVSPVSVNGIAEINLTPAAFFVLSGGGKAGSGWNIPLGNGIGLNIPENEADPHPRTATIDGRAFDGLIWSTWGAGTLQFDLGAVLPGAWNHVLFLTRQEFRYSAFTGAGAGDSWVFENDDAENQNGWTYNATYILGYHMPLSPVLDTIALMAELRKSLYDTPGGSFWGENLGYWIFSTLFNFSLSPRLNSTLALQMRTRRNHGTSNFDNDYFYRDLEISGGGWQRRLLFYRAALVFNYKIR